MSDDDLSFSEDEATESSSEEPAPKKEESKGPSLDPSTHFAFDHKIFQVADARFALSGPDRIPAMRMNVGEHEASIQLDSLCQEFDIDPESADGRMLEQVAAGLKFVKDIRPGDTIPRELLDGTASWSIDDSHGVLAKNKVMFAVANMADGRKKARPPANELAKEMAKPETKEAIEQGYGKILDKLGKKPGDRDEITDLIDRMVRELAYIEALRDRYSLASAIMGKLNQVSSLYSSDRVFLAEVSRVQVLIRPPIKEFHEIFAEVDAQTNNVVNLIKTFNRQVVYVRQMRDELHQKMLIWDEAIEHWQLDLSRKSKASREAVQFTYRFVAHNFPQSTDWF